MAACVNQYTVHSGPEALRHEFMTNVMHDTYLPVFQSQVMAADVAQIMLA